MKLPFVLRSRYEAEKQLWERIIREQSERIAGMETERRLVISNLALMGIGYPTHDLTQLRLEAEEPEQKQPKGPMPLRPSVIMRRMDRLAEERYLRKVHPSRGNEELAMMLGRHGRNQKHNTRSLCSG